jgi:hypothetical protein
VKRCLAQGYTRQQIRERLIDAGYDMPTADSALEDVPVHFSATPSLPPSQRVFFVAGILAFVIVAGGSLLWLQFAYPVTYPAGQALSEYNVPEQNTPAPVATEASDVRPYRELPAIPARVGWPSRPIATLSSPVPFSAPTCAEATCMIDALPSCAPRKYVLDELPLDFYNISATTSGSITIGQSVTNGCTVWVKVDKQQIRFYNEYVNDLKRLGLSAEQINFLEAEANQAAASSLSATGQCAVRTDVLRAMFTSWSRERFVGVELAKAGCPILYG